MFLETDIQKKMSKNSITLGYILTKYRTQAGLDIRQMSSKISIDDMYIIALEKGDYHVFSSPNQAIPIIKRVSYVLGLKYNLLLDMYYQEYEQYSQRSQQQSTHIVLNYKMIKMTLASLVGIVIIGYLGLQVYQINYTPVLTLKNDDKYEIQDSSLYTLEGSMTRSGQLTLNGQKVTLKEAGQFEVILNLRDGENRLELQVSKDDTILKTMQKIVYKK